MSHGVVCKYHYRGKLSLWLTSVTVWLILREGVAKSPCRCGSIAEIYTVPMTNLSLDTFENPFSTKKGGKMRHRFFKFLGRFWHHQWIISLTDLDVRYKMRLFRCIFVSTFAIFAWSASPQVMTMRLPSLMPRHSYPCTVTCNCSVLLMRTYPPYLCSSA